MENEKRLIDANALKREFEWLKSVVNESSKGEVMDVMQRIDNAPTVDAVEVLRCKDCKHAHLTIGSEVKYCDMWSNGEELYLPPDFHCAAGERRADNATD